MRGRVLPEFSQHHHAIATWCPDPDQFGRDGTQRRACRMVQFPGWAGHSGETCYFESAREFLPRHHRDRVRGDSVIRASSWPAQSRIIRSTLPCFVRSSPQGRKSSRTTWACGSGHVCLGRKYSRGGVGTFSSHPLDWKASSHGRRGILSGATYTSHLRQSRSSRVLFVPAHYWCMIVIETHAFSHTCVGRAFFIFCPGSW